MMAQRIDRLSVMTEAAANIVERYRQKVDKGEMAEAAAREAALADIGAMRHGRDNYVYVNDAAGTVVAHPSAKVVGRNLMGMADPTGFRFVADVMPRAKRDGVATFRYVWAQEGQAAPVPKIGLFRYYAPWDIYIGVSEYVSDLRAMIVEQVERLAVAGLVIMLVLGGASLLLVRSVVRPMARLRATMGTLAEGRTDLAVPEAGRRDEVGAMARAVLVFRDNAIERERLRGESEAEELRRMRRAAALNELIQGFEASITGVVAGVAAASGELRGTAQAMTATATQTASQSTTVAAAAEEASANVETVAVAAEELGASVQEIGRQVDGSARLAQAAVAEAGQTARQVQALTEATARIGDVVGLISSIAAQTNLLALNATIEAARAGGRRPRLRGGRRRGQGTGRPDREGDRGDHRPDRHDPGLDRPGGECDRPDHRADRGDLDRGDLDRRGGGGAGCGGDAGDRAQRRAGRRRHRRGDGQHRRRGGGRRRRRERRRARCWSRPRTCRASPSASRPRSTVSWPRSGRPEGQMRATRYTKST